MWPMEKYFVLITILSLQLRSTKDVSNFWTKSILVSQCAEYIIIIFFLFIANQKSCCSGYCIDLLRLLGDHCNFTYSLHLSFNEYGSLERNNKTGKQDWNGLIGQLVQEYADLIVAPLTINPERAQVMEFSKPFKYQGITILQKRVIVAEKKIVGALGFKTIFFFPATTSFTIGFFFTTIQVHFMGAGFGFRACGSPMLVPLGSF